MKNLILLSVAAVALASCAPMMPAATATNSGSTTTPYTLNPQPNSAAVAAGANGTTGGGTLASTTPAVGSLSVTNTANATGGSTATTARLTGLRPSTYYVAHYHLQGSQNPTPCLSGGALIMSSTLIGQTDASGALVLSGTVPTNDIKNATYFNVHTASDSRGTPADGGVSCSPVRF